MAACGFMSKIAAWYENDGKGNFTRHILSKDQEAYDLRILDINGDKKPDILIGGRSTNNCIWFENPGK